VIELVPAVHVDLVKHPSVIPERSVAPEDHSRQAAAKLDCSHKEGSVSEASVLMDQGSGYFGVWSRLCSLQLAMVEEGLVALLPSWHQVGARWLQVRECLWDGFMWRSRLLSPV
jgi:hypothetical protein